MLTAAQLFQTYYELRENTEAQEQVVDDWPEEWPGAESVEEILSSSFGHTGRDARQVAVRLVDELSKAGRVEPLELEEGFRLLAGLDRDDLRIDFPKIDDYMSAIFAEATQLGLISREADAATS